MSESDSTTGRGAARVCVVCGQEDSVFHADPFGCITALRAAKERVEAKRDEAREALRSLSNEVSGALGIAEIEIRDAVGSTNVACIKDKLRRAAAVVKGE